MSPVRPIRTAAELAFVLRRPLEFSARNDFGNVALADGLGPFLEGVLARAAALPCVRERVEALGRGLDGWGAAVPAEREEVARRWCELLATLTAGPGAGTGTATATATASVSGSASVSASVSGSASVSASDSDSASDSAPTGRPHRRQKRASPDSGVPQPAQAAGRATAAPQRWQKLLSSWRSAPQDVQRSVGGIPSWGGGWRPRRCRRSPPCRAARGR